MSSERGKGGSDLARVPYVEAQEAPPDLREVYSEIHGAGRQLLNLHKLLAHSPAALRAFEALRTAWMSGSLDPKLRELAFLKVSEVNGCGY